LTVGRGTWEDRDGGSAIETLPETKSSDRTSRSGLWAKIALAVLSLAATLLVAEGAARLVLPPHQIVEIESAVTRTTRSVALEERTQEHGIDVLIDWSGEHGIRLHPGVRATIHNHRLSDRDVVITTNSLGLRHPALGPKSEGEYRVLVLGDSITFGDYVSFDDTYPAMLARRFEGRRRTVTVINAGLPGASTSNELYFYLEIAEAVDPDLVLVGMYLNDAQESGRFYARSLREPYASSRFLSFLAARLEMLRLDMWSDEVVPEIDPEWREDFQGERRLRPGDMWDDRDGFDYEIYNAHLDFGIAWNPRSWEVLEPIVRTLSLATRQRGHELAIFLFPVHIQVKGTIEDFRPQQSFAAMCESTGLTCLDLTPALRADFWAHRKELFYDHCHLTPRGNAVVAAALAEWLDEEELVPR
jgi:lysophospholipase L1-like esterase